MRSRLTAEVIHELFPSARLPNSPRSLAGGDTLHESQCAGTLVPSTVLSLQLANHLPLAGGTLAGTLTGISGTLTSLKIGTSPSFLF